MFYRVEANRDKFITTGLWSYSRYPHYFGEIIFWLALALDSIIASVFAPELEVHWVWILVPFGAVLAIFLIFFIFNTSEKEKDAKYKDNAAYVDYKRKTSTFLPIKAGILPPVYEAPNSAAPAPSAPLQAGTAAAASPTPMTAVPVEATTSASTLLPQVVSAV